MNNTHVVPATLEFIIVNGQLNTQPSVIREVIMWAPDQFLLDQVGGSENTCQSKCHLNWGLKNKWQLVRQRWDQKVPSRKKNTYEVQEVEKEHFFSLLFFSPLHAFICVLCYSTFSNEIVCILEYLYFRNFSPNSLA